MSGLRRCIHAFILLSTLMTGACASHQIYPSPIETTALRRSLKNEYEVRVLKNQTYVLRSEENALQGDLYLPRGDGPFPAVLVVHGGSWSGRSRADMTSISRELAHRGFVAFNISYRFAPNYRFPAQLDDLKSAVQWLRSHASEYRINPEKIGGFGYSSGAHLVSLLAVTRDPSQPSTQLQAVVGGGTPADLTLSPDSRAVIQFLGTTWVENPELFKKASPVFHVTSDDPPFFLYHGKGDDVVSPHQTLRFAEALKKAGVPVETYLVPVLGHLLTFALNSGSVNHAIDFLDSHLK